MATAPVEPAEGSRLRDPITFEVFRSALVSLADEMGLMTQRTAHSPTINQAMDFSTALCDDKGQVLAQGHCMMIHIGTVPDAMKAVLNRYGDQLTPGDVFVFNHTPEAAQHLPDFYVVKPYFVNSRMVGFGVSTVHHVDVSGMTAGGMDMNARSIFQEGLQLPVVRLYEAGRLNESVYDIVMRNTRAPDLVAGDLDGQLAALHLGEVGIHQLIDRYGLDAFSALGAELLAYTEDLTRQAIRSLPDGYYDFEDWLDDDGAGGPPVRLHVAVTVDGDHIHFDWAGSAPQVPSALNCHIANTKSCTYGALMGIFGDSIPSNEGFYRPITISAPPGSVVNADRTAALGVRGITCYRLIDTVLGALGRCVPDRVPAGSCGGPVIIKTSGNDRVRGPFIQSLGGIAAAWGGGLDRDGLDGTSPFGANIAYVPVEEHERPGFVRINHFAYVPDSGGPGRWRGGLALSLGIEFLADETDVQLRSQRRHFQSYGLQGGRPGSTSMNLLQRGETEVELPVLANVTVHRGDTILHIHSSGGGYGDPLTRDPQAVLDDVLDDKVSHAHARSEYGVVIAPGAAIVDSDATFVLRRRGGLTADGFEEVTDE